MLASDEASEGLVVANRDSPKNKEKRMKHMNTSNGKKHAERKEDFDLGALFDRHIAREFADHDVKASMETMVSEPYVHCVPIMTGGVGGLGVRKFYSEHFINQIPKDAKVTPISRTVGKDQVVDEF